MKALRYIFLLGSVGSLLTFSNCGGGGSNPEPLADQQFTKLSKTWKISSVKLGGVDRTAEYQAGIPSDLGPMRLTISGTKGNAATYAYSVSGRPALSPWPKTGTWEFGSKVDAAIVRDPNSTQDKLTVAYTVDAAKLTISFNFSGTGYANSRAEVVTGNWIFEFVPN